MSPSSPTSPLHHQYPLLSFPSPILFLTLYQRLRASTTLHVQSVWTTFPSLHQLLVLHLRKPGAIYRKHFPPSGSATALTKTQLPLTPRVGILAKSTPRTGPNKALLQLYYLSGIRHPKKCSAHTIIVLKW